MPRVSVGLPVHNGEAYVSRAIDSILAQTLGDFELLISDNASTDRTGEICRAYAAADERVRYQRCERNLGAAPNFNRVFDLSSGEYFKWAAHDDALAPGFLNECVHALDADPTAVLAFSRVRVIDAAQGLATQLPEQLPRVGSRLPHERFADLVTERHGCFHIWGLMRSSVLSKTPRIASFVGSDRALLAELALHGRFVEIPETLFSLGAHSGRSIKSLPFHLRAGWYDASNDGQLHFPNWRILAEYRLAVARTPLSHREKLGCHVTLAIWPFRHGNLARLILDLPAGLLPGGWRLHQKVKEWRRRGRRAIRAWLPGSE